MIILLPSVEVFYMIQWTHFDIFLADNIFSVGDFMFMIGTNVTTNWLNLECVTDRQPVYLQQQLQHSIF